MLRVSGDRAWVALNEKGRVSATSSLPDRADVFLTALQLERQPGSSRDSVIDRKVSGDVEPMPGAVPCGAIRCFYQGTPAALDFISGGP